MAVPYYGDFLEDDSVNIPFNTFSSNDPAASVTATELIASDIFVHKDGSATAITTDGASIDIDAPGVGAHMITIDTSVHADYATGSEYAVRVNGMTVDAGLINAWVGAFSIERAGGALAQALLLSTKQDSDMVVVGADHDKTQSDIVLLSTKQDSDMVVVGADHDKTQSDIVIIDDFLDLEMPAVTSNLVIIASDVLAIEADTNELQVDNVPTLISTLSTKVDSDMTLVIADHDKTQSDIVLISSKLDSDMTLVLADHDKTQSDIVLVDNFIDTEIAALTSNVLIIDNFLDTEMAAQTSNLLIIASDVLAIEADTNELQVDNIPGSLTTLSTKVDSDMTLVLADHDKTQSDIVLLSTKQDSDMTVVATAHTKTQSDIVIIDDFLDDEMAAVTSNLVITNSDLVVITTDVATLSTKQDSDMVVLNTSHTKTQSDIVLVDNFIDTEIAALTSNSLIICCMLGSVFH